MAFAAELESPLRSTATPDVAILTASSALERYLV